MIYEKVYLVLNIDTLYYMFMFVVLAGSTQTSVGSCHSLMAIGISVGHATPKAMGIMIGIMLIIWIVGKLFSKG